MKISLIYIGKTNQNFVKEGCEMYFKRIKRYTNFEEVRINDVKNGNKMQAEILKVKEGELLLNKIQATDFVILLDEKGKSFTSVKFANWIEQKMVQGATHLVFIVGGAFGFSEAVYQRANMKLQLSTMTFSHQIIRVIFGEQLYRAFTIIHREPYHND
jgi:23S rRNA (pseudouridine1915-N3)-methyltransferase